MNSDWSPCSNGYKGNKIIIRHTEKPDSDNRLCSVRPFHVLRQFVLVAVRRGAFFIVRKEVA